MTKTILVSLVLFFVSVLPVNASGFVLNSIGSLNTGGNQYGEWWYQGDNPTLSGTTTANATVDVSVGGATSTVTANAAGAWSAPTTITTGDHQISLTSSGSTIAFTLHLNQTMPEGVGAPAASTQPVAGVSTPTYMLIAGGVTVTLLGLLIRRRLQPVNG